MYSLNYLLSLFNGKNYQSDQYRNIFVVKIVCSQAYQINPMTCTPCSLMTSKTGRPVSQYILSPFGTRITSKRVKRLMFVPRFSVLRALSEDTYTAKWDLFVVYVAIFPSLSLTRDVTRASIL